MELNGTGNHVLNVKSMKLSHNEWMGKSKFILWLRGRVFGEWASHAATTTTANAATVVACAAAATISADNAPTTGWLAVLQAIVVE